MSDFFRSRPPVLQNLWSLSYTLVQGACSGTALSLFYWIVDVKGIKPLIFLFKPFLWMVPLV